MGSQDVRSNGEGDLSVKAITVSQTDAIRGSEGGALRHGPGAGRWAGSPRRTPSGAPLVHGQPFVVPWYHTTLGIVFFAFVAATCFLYGPGQQRMLGAAVAVALALKFGHRFQGVLQRIRPVPVEFWLYSAWVLWVGLTGWIVAANQEKFGAAFQVLVQMLIMAWASYCVLRIQRSYALVPLGLLAGALIQVALVFLGVGTVGPESDLMSVEGRVAGSTTNPNNLGFIMVWGALSALFFWRGSHRWRLLRHAAILLMLALTGFVLLATGSKKSTIGFGVLLFLWIAWGLRRERGMRQAITGMIAGVAVISFVLLVGPKLIGGTPVGHRFEVFLEQGGGSIEVAAQSNIRYYMYTEGFKIAARNPIFGVGLNNFGEHFFTTQYSHSDLMESLATTGVVGFVLYQGFFAILLYRARRLLRFRSDATTRYRIRMQIVGIAVMVVIGLGAPHFYSQPVFLLLTSFSVMSTGLWSSSRKGVAAGPMAVAHFPIAPQASQRRTLQLNLTRRRGTPAAGRAMDRPRRLNRFDCDVRAPGATLCAS